tara:strand:- start:252 stop:1070 length:819 start_codon:yes stop_codon:yes gene_type:complete
MGSGIAATFACSEFFQEVIVWGRNGDSLTKAYSQIEKQINRFAKKEQLDAEQRDIISKKLKVTTSLNDLADSSIYIEAISEIKEDKVKVFTALRNIISSEAIVGTNTSSLSITELALCTDFPSNFIGLHFFNPTSVMQLVEVIKGVATSDETLKKSLSIVKLLKKEAVIVNESPGFIVNRMLIPMINEAIAIFSEQVASVEDIDKAMMLGANHPIGPLALADLIGNDVCLSIMETLHFETGDPKYRAHAMLRKYVRAGMLGRKTKSGFYNYK